MLAPGPRPGLPSTWVSGRERLRAQPTVARGAGVRVSGGTTRSGVAHHYGAHPSHGGGVRYGAHRHGGRWSSPVFAPTWGWYGSCAPSLYVGLWGFGCGCASGPAYVEPYYPAPIYAEPYYPAPAYVEPTYPQLPYAEPTYPEPSQAIAPAQPEAVPPEAVSPEAGGPRMPTAEQQDTIRRSLESFQAGRAAEALALLDAAVAADAEFGDAWLGIAYAAWALERYDRAALAVTRAATLGAFPRGYRFDPTPLFGGPEALLAARTRLETRVAQAPKDADARLVLAWLLVSVGERPAAQEQIQQVLTLRPADEAAPILSIALLPPAPLPAAPLPPAPAAKSAAPTPR